MTTRITRRFTQFLRRASPLNVALDEGDGPPVVLIHGIASSSVTFEHVVPLLVDRHRVIAIDLMGFGSSPARSGATFTLREHTRALARTLRYLRLREPIVLVGHSMGALIAARFAARRRSYEPGVNRVVLVSPPVYLDPDAIGDSRERAVMDAFHRFYGFLRANKAFTITAAAQVAAYLPIKNVLSLSDSNWRAFALSLEHVIQTQSTMSDVAAIRVPVDLVYGTLDPLLLHEGLRILGQLRGVTTHRVAGGDHFIRSRMAHAIADAIDPT